MDNRISVLKILAAFMVVFLHLSGSNFYSFSDRWASANLYDSLTRAGVPLFFMISGATLLGKREPLFTFLSKRAARILPPLLLWSVIYLWWLDHNGVQTGNWMVAILRGPTMYHLWYFYAALGLYAFTPVLRRIFQHSSNSELGWYVGLWFAAALLFPSLSALTTGGCVRIGMGRLAEIYHLQYFAGFAGYMLLGALLARYAKAFGGWKVGIPLYAGAVLATMTIVYLQSQAAGRPCEAFYDYFSPLVALAAAGLFISILGRAPAPEMPWLTRVAGCMLGIYGLHVLAIEQLWLRAGLSPKSGNPWISTPLTAVIVFCACLVVIDTIRRAKAARIAV
jgi:surface polysaccharide O-acyltransferase-like enzyme